MQFRNYENVESFNNDVLETLLKDEVSNNILLSILTESKARYATDWLMATVVNEGGLALAALCTKPFNLLLHGAAGVPQGCVELLAREIRRIGFSPPGVLAERVLAQRFAEAYCAGSAGKPHLSMNVMRLDRLAEYNKAPGTCRMLEESDMFFVPYWEHAFSVDCRVHAFSIPENVERIRTRVGKDTHFIWEDGAPVSQAVFGRETPNGAIVNWVYTPPHYRGRGYATSVVAELTRSLLERGKSFCCLFADADNPISCEIYRKLGYYDVCLFDDIRFE